MDDNLEDISSKFECVQIAMNKDKNGYVLKLAVHPSDAPEDLLRDPVGQRYLAVMVRIGDQGQPETSPHTAVGLQAVKVAATICGDVRFQQWMAMAGMIDQPTEEAAVAAVRGYCGIKSRSELKTNSKARDKLFSLRDEFIASLRG